VFRAVAITACIFALPSAARAQSQGALNFFKNYFVTGDYVVGGVGLRGTGTVDAATGVKMASGSIPIANVPVGADIVAAILYWQAIESTPTSNPSIGYFRNQGILGKQIAPDGVQACWSSGGGSGTTQGASFLRSYRANVLHLLPTDPNTGKRMANGSHSVRVPDSGSAGSQSPSSGNQVNLAEGASLVIVYRDPSKPLRAVIIYDGGKILNQQFTSMTQSMYGYFQSSTAGSDAKLTHLAGDGDANFGDAVTVTGTSTTTPLQNQYRGTLGFSWDNPTFNVPLTAGTLQDGKPITSEVVATGSSVDCITWTAMIAGVNVQDSDYDGLLDPWETSASTLRNPSAAEAGAQPLPPIDLMGADKNVQDIFVEIGYLKAGSGYSTPLGDVDPHTHLPSQNVLFKVARMFHNAKTAGPRKFGVTGPINLHFDVGNRYQAASFNYNVCKNPNNWTEQCSIIPASLARGGEEIDELTIASPPGLENPAFPGFFGVVGWKGPFDILRDQPLNFSSESACAQAGTGCERRFDENRRHAFKYALFAHALGVPRATSDLQGTPYNDTKTPRTTSGVADGGDGGGDVLITLGFWDGHTGTELVQAGTLAHELGHTLGLRHGGPAATVTDTAPNCKPNYQSVMNYFFQVRGLGPSLPGGAAIDFSRQVLTTVYDKNLSDTALTDVNTNQAMLYPTRWYAPVGNWFASTIGATAVERYCDGTPAPPGQMVRVDGTTNGAIDWNFNGTLDPGPATQDVGFNGVIDGIAGQSDASKGEKLVGYNDWASVDLRQTASRRNFNGLSLEMTLDDTGVFDWGTTDPPLGVFDWGVFDWGVFDWGVFDWGVFDWGVFDWGVFDWGSAEGVFDWGGPLDDGQRGDIDFPAAEAAGNPPTGLRFTPTRQTIDLFWEPPTVNKPAVAPGSPDQYHVWRAAGNAPISQTNLPVRIATVGAATLTYSDTTTKNNQQYWYFVTVTVNGKTSGPSNIILASR
jgi:hypothetical protein